MSVRRGSWVNYTGKPRNSLPLSNGAKSQTSFSIINWTAICKNECVPCLARFCCFISFSLHYISEKGQVGKGKKELKKSRTFDWLAAAAHQRKRRGGEREKALIVFVFPKCGAIFLACHVWPCCEVMHCFFSTG